MGVVYKLSSDVRNYILNQKKDNPEASCRSLIHAIYTNYKIRVSKSSINMVIKAAGLSLPVGRHFRPSPIVSGQEINKVGEKGSAAPGSAQIRSISLNFGAGGQIWLDSLLRTIWSRPDIPPELSASLSTAKDLAENLTSARPVVFLMGSGYDYPTQATLTLMSNLNKDERRALELTYFDSNLKETSRDNIQLEKKKEFILGVWPWQYKQYLTMKIMGTKEEVQMSGREARYQVLGARIALSQPIDNKGVILNGGVIYRPDGETPYILLISNIDAISANCSKLAAIYLANWPRPEDSLKDLSRKIESTGRLKNQA